MFEISRVSGLAIMGAVAVNLALASPAASQAVANNPPNVRVQTQAHAHVSTGTRVYLLRGLMNIFSLGMDDLANKLNARGVRSTVHNHSEWQVLSDEIAASYKKGNRSPVVLIGHSLGADAVMLMGEYLDKQNVPVALIVPFDGTASYAASKNVARVFNLTQRTYARMTRGPGFHGELINMDVTGPSIDHVNIDKSARLHSLVIARVLALGGRGGAPKPSSSEGPTASIPSAAASNSHATATDSTTPAVR
jgi:hypothetical protein